MSFPTSFGNENFVLDVFVEASQSITHCIDNGGREIGRGMEGMDQLVAFVDRGGKKILVEEEPVIALGLDEEGHFFACFLDFFKEVFVQHGFIARGSQ